MSGRRGFDYIVVGGSSARVVAARLVTSQARVLLLKRRPVKTNPTMHMPAGYMKFLAKDTYLAMHQTEPQPQLNGRGPTHIFGHPDDLKMTVAGFWFARQALAASPMRDLIDREIFLGAEVTRDEVITAHSKRTDGLRIIDASFMPAIISGNAAVLAAAGKAPNLVLS